MTQSFGIVLPLRKRHRIDPGDLIRELRLLVEETGAVVKIDPRMAHQAPKSGGMFSLRKAPPETVAFELDGVRLRVSLHAEPLADRLEMGRYVNPVMWEVGLGEFTDHRAYFRIHEAGIEGEEGPDAIFDRAAAVTATASVVARLSGPVGAIWLAGRNSVPMRSFGVAMEQLKEGAAPLSFWLRWHVLPPSDMEELHSGLVTAGLAPFVGRELMARPSTIETRLMIDHAFELARRMIDDKMAVSDNQVIDGEDIGRIRLRLISRSRKGDAPVVEMIPLDAPPVKPTVAQVEAQKAAAQEAAVREALARDAGSGAGPGDGPANGPDRDQDGDGGASPAPLTEAQREEIRAIVRGPDQGRDPRRAGAGASKGLGVGRGLSFTAGGRSVA
ncbi:MAG: hypothetical protein ACFBRM_07725 [Pikeienuella sp.]